MFEPPGQLLVYDGVSPSVRAVLVSLGEGSRPRVSPRGSEKFPVERFTVACWRISLNNSRTATAALTSARSSSFRY